MQELIIAAQTGNLSFLQTAYKEDESIVFTADSDNCSLLHWAAIVITCYNYRIIMLMLSGFYWITL